jgi:hypothetical protein
MSHVFKRKTVSPIEMTQLYAIKEIKENHIHYKSAGNEGVISIFRIEGYDPSLLEKAQIQGLVEDFTSFFGINSRFKLVSMRIAYTIPPKNIALNIDHFGVNFAKNRYLDRIDEINANEDLRQQAYFLVIDGPSIDKNIETFNTATSPLSDAHIVVHPAIPEEVSQIFQEL